MSSFQDIVLSIAVFFLIITLLIIGIALYRNRSTLSFPPVVADCPDYWIAQNDGKNNICSNGPHGMCRAAMAVACNPSHTTSFRSPRWPPHCTLQSSTSLACRVLSSDKAVFT